MNIAICPYKELFTLMPNIKNINFKKHGTGAILATLEIENLDR